MSNFHKKKSMHLKLYKISALICLIIYLLLPGCANRGNNKDNADKYFQAGLSSIKAGKEDEAIINFKNAIQKYPFHSEARFELATIYRNTSRPVMAGRELNIAIINDPDFSKAKRALATLYYENSAFQELIPLCEDLLQVKPDDLEILNILGNAFLVVGQADNGKTTFEKALAAEPGSIEAKIGLIQSYMAIQQPGEARNLMEELAAKNPTNINLQILLANLYSETGQFDDALNTLESLLIAHPQNPLSYLSLARFYLQANIPAKAESYLRKALSKGISDNRLHQGLGIILHQQKEYEEALQLFEEAASLWPDHKKNTIILADYYVFLKNYPKAIATYNAIIDKWPAMKVIKSKIAEIHLSKGEFSQAEPVVEQLIAEQTANPRGHLLRGLLWEIEGNTPKARKAFSKVRDLAPDSPDGFLYYGMTFFKEKDYQIVESMMFKALEKEPDSVRARMGLVALYVENNNFALAQTELDKILRTQPDHYSARVMRAGIYLKAGNFDGAIADYLYLVKNDPNSPVANFRLADAYLYKGDLKKALSGFNALKKSYPDSVTLTGRMIRVHLALNQKKEALALSNTFLNKNPDNFPISLMKAEILLASKKLKEAETILSVLIDNQPKADQAMVLLARIKKMKKDNQAATRLFSQAAAINPKNIDALMSLAAHFKEMGDHKQTIETYEQLLTYSPAFVPAMNDQAYLLAETGGNLGSAISLAQKAYELAPGNADIIDTLGWVYFKMDNFQMAKKYFKQAHEVNPKDPFFLYHLGVTLFTEQSIEQAEEHFSKAIALGLSGEELVQAQASIKHIEETKQLIMKAAKFRDSGNYPKAAALYETYLEKNEFSAPIANELAYIYAQMEKNLDRALELAKKAHSMIDEKGYTADTLGWVYYKRGAYSLAKLHINNAIDEEPEKGLYRYHLGMIFFKEKEFNEATENFSKALSLGLETQDRKSTTLQLMESMKL